jgi:amidase
MVLADRILNSETMARLQLLLLTAVLGLTAGTCHSFEFQEATLDAIQLGFKNGSLTSTALVQHYLGQISRLNPLLHAVIEVNPDALRQAAQADAERRSSSGDGRIAGGLHGVPVLLKDNIATRDGLNTTAGSLALLGSVVRRDAGVVARLRRAGAVVLRKANMDEWANFRSAIGTGGWSARGGQGKVSALSAFRFPSTNYIGNLNMQAFRAFGLCEHIAVAGNVS